MTKVEQATVAYRISNPLQEAEGRRSAAKVVPVYQRSFYQKIETIKDGISKEEPENLKEQTGVDYTMLSRILSITTATLHDKKGKEWFDTTVSERILLLADIYSYGYMVFKEQEKCNRWMKTPNRALVNEILLNLAKKIYGIEEVKNLLEG